MSHHCAVVEDDDGGLTYDARQSNVTVVTYKKWKQLYITVPTRSISSGNKRLCGDRLVAKIPTNGKLFLVSSADLLLG